MESKERYQLKDGDVKSARKDYILTIDNLLQSWVRSEFYLQMMYPNTPDEKSKAEINKEIYEIMLHIFENRLKKIFKKSWPIEYQDSPVSNSFDYGRKDD